MLLKNEQYSKQEQSFNNSQNSGLGGPNILNTSPLFVKNEYPTNEIHKGGNTGLSKDILRNGNSTVKLPLTSPFPITSNQDPNSMYLQSIPPQIQPHPYFHQNFDHNIPYSIPPMCYQQITSSSLSSYLNEGIQIQRNIVSTTTMISPQRTDAPNLIYSNPLAIHGANNCNNRSQSHNGVQSSLPDYQHPPINQLTHSFNNLSTDNFSNRSLNNSCHLPVNLGTNHYPPVYGNHLSNTPLINHSHSTTSLPQSNRNLEMSLANATHTNSNPYSTIRNQLNHKTQFSNSSSPALRSSQLQQPLFNTNHLTPSRRMINVLEERVLIPPTGIANPVPNILHITKKSNCNPNIMRCTLNTLPMTEDLLNKTRLPLAILLHPFRDLPSLQVIRSKKIIRCRTLSCRAYINPFVSFTDQKRWKCNMCLRMNELSDDSVYNQSTGEYFDTLKRFELKLPTVEYIAPKEYSLKNNQVPIYIFLVDISSNATHGLYHNTMGRILNTIEQLLDRIPGYQYAKFSIIGYDSAIHFYTINERGFQEIVISDISSPVEIPVTTGIVVDMNQYHDTIQELLSTLLDNVDDSQLSQQGRPQLNNSPSCLGTALLVAKELFGGSGGRITIFNASCPTVGEGILSPRIESKSNNVLPLSPDKEFYKTLSLEFAQAQISVDLFQLGTISCDLASLSIISRYCSGSLFYYPGLFHHATVNEQQSLQFNEPQSNNENQRLISDLHRYLTRKIGFEGVLRIRFSGGFNILSSHGNFFARASDLYSMANVNPDAGIAIRLGIEDSFCDSSIVYIQAALLYTSSVGERRIRVHTLCLPVSVQIEDLFRAADHQAVAILLAKTVADRLQTSGNVVEAREALINAVIDPSVAFGKFCLSSSQRVTSLPFPYHMRMLPLYVWGMLQNKCLRVAPKNEIDLSVAVLDAWRNKPLSYLIVDLYPNLYNIIGIIDLSTKQRDMFQSLSPGEEIEDVDDTGACEGDGTSEGSSEESDDTNESSEDTEAESSISCYNPKSATVNNGHKHNDNEDDDEDFWYPEQLHLTIQSLSQCGVYLLDCADNLILVIGPDTPRAFLKLILDIECLAGLNNISELPELNNPCSAHLRVFIREIQVERPLGSTLFIVRNDNNLLYRAFMDHLIEDDQVNVSYHRFLQHIQKKVNSNS